MPKRARFILFAGLAATACGDDALTHVPVEPAMCSDGVTLLSEGCPQALNGSIVGRLCDNDNGIWLQGVTATLQTDDFSIDDVTDIEGRFSLTDVPAASYYIYFTGPSYANVLPAIVQPGQPTTIGASDCLAPPGHLRGRICDSMLSQWVGNATVTLDDAAATSVTTDAFGSFMFYSVAAGSYVLSITHPSGFSATRMATVTSGLIEDIGPSNCVGGQGTVIGRICGGSGVWLTDAAVVVDLGNGNTVETTTDGNGDFTLSGVPAGTYDVTVTKGSFSTTFSVTVAANQPTVLPTPVCIPPDTRMAVVTGMFDSVENVLTNLGYQIKDRYTSTTPTPVSSTGTVDIISGDSDTFWMTDFLTDPVWMADYQIIFLNCGLDDGLISSGTTTGAAFDNLRNFVTNGGSIYASDWAAEVVRVTFPGRINFFNGNTSFGASRVGSSETNQLAQVTDAGLQTSLGQTSVTINLDLPQWSVMDVRSGQPAGLNVLITGNVDYNVDPFGFFTDTVNNAPLVVHFDYGTGRVLFTSAHNESQNSPDLERVLNYIVFEL